MAKSTKATEKKVSPKKTVLKEVQEPQDSPLSDLQKMVAEEVAPLRESLNRLTEENAQLVDSTTTLKASLAAAEKKVKDLMLEASGLSEKLKNVTVVAKEAARENAMLKESIEAIKKRNVRLVSEMKAINESASKRVKLAVERAEADKQAFIRSVTESLEKQVGQLLHEAFSGAKMLFESDMSAVQTDLLSDLGNLLLPYVTDPSLPRRTETLRKAIREAKEALVKSARTFKEYQSKKDAESKKLLAKLTEANKLLQEAKFDKYKDNLVKNLPETIRNFAREKLNEAKNVDDAKNILQTIIRTSSATGGIKTPPKPVVVTEAAQAQGGDNRVEALLRESLGRAEVDATVDPELLRLAGISKRK
jgi:DNA repair exonuclease SbcCD ATPase subunit